MKKKQHSATLLLAMRITFLQLTLAFIFCGSLFANTYNGQENHDKKVFAATVSGIITDEKGVPLVGATISVKGKFNLVTTTNNAGRFKLDIGANSANRPRNVFVGTAVEGAAGAYFGWNSRAALYSDGTNNIRLSGWGASINLLQFGGITPSFPALKRSTTSLQARLADDTAFTNIQGKLTTDTAYTAGALVATGYITIYDSTGTAYRVPCLV
jgi:hypothetical protein